MKNLSKASIILALSFFTFNAGFGQRTYPLQWLWGLFEEKEAPPNNNQDWASQAKPLVKTINSVFKKQDPTEADLNTLSITIAKLLRIDGESFSDGFLRGQIKKMAGANAATPTAQPAAKQISPESDDKKPSEKELTLETRNTALKQELAKTQDEFKSQKTALEKELAKTKKELEEKNKALEQEQAKAKQKQKEADSKEKTPDKKPEPKKEKQTEEKPVTPSRPEGRTESKNTHQPSEEKTSSERTAPVTNKSESSTSEESSPRPEPNRQRLKTADQVQRGASWKPQARGRAPK